jgi:hypothetical protein
LRTLIATAKKNKEHRAALDEVHPIARAIIHAKLAYAFEELYIPKSPA